MSASTDASKSSASAMPASACRTTPTPSGRAGMVSMTSGGGFIRLRRSSCAPLRSPPRERAEHRGVDERRGCEVDYDAAAARQRLVQPLAQRGSRVDVVLALHDDHHN